jgi:hypothetical protein
MEKEIKDKKPPAKTKEGIEGYSKKLSLEYADGKITFDVLHQRLHRKMTSMGRALRAEKGTDQEEVLKQAYVAARQEWLNANDVLLGVDSETESATTEGQDEQYESTSAAIEVPEEPIAEPKPPAQEMLNLNPAPYSGSIRTGEKVKFGEHEWRLNGYDSKTGDAIIQRAAEGYSEVQAISQEQLYAQNQDYQQEPANAGNTETSPASNTNLVLDRQVRKEPERNMPEPEMTLDEIEAKIKFAKDTGRVPGIGPEGLSYWEEQKRIYIEKQKAEEIERRVKELENILRQKYSELAEAVKNGKFAKDTARLMETAMWEKNVKELEKEIKDLEKELEKLNTNPEGKEWKKEVKNVYDKAKEKGKKVWGFVKERAKGFGTFGLWEIKEAEVMRRGTKNTDEEIKAISQSIQQEEGLNEEEALKEATDIQEVLGRSATAESYEQISNIITGNKSEQNNKIEKDIVDYAVEQLGKRLESRPIIANYRSVHGGEKVMTQENIDALRAELSAELKKLRNGQIRKDRLNYASLMRKNLDPKWWYRYIYGPAEVVLLGIGFKFLLTKLAAEKAGVVAGKTGGEKVAEVALKDTVWGEAKRQLVHNGILNPTNTQIQQVATVMSKESFVSVPPWEVAGNVLHTKMQAGYLLKLNGALAEIAKIKATMLAT